VYGLNTAKRRSRIITSGKCPGDDFHSGDVSPLQQDHATISPSRKIADWFGAVLNKSPFSVSIVTGKTIRDVIQGLILRVLLQGISLHCGAR
jgi:hypothetical protein